MLHLLTTNPEAAVAGAFTLGQGFSSAVRIALHIWKRRPRRP